MTDFVDSSTFRFAAFAAGLGLIALLERLFPFRRATVSALRRWGTNLSLAAVNAVLLTLGVSAAVVAVADWVALDGSGLLNRIDVTEPVRIVITLAALDLALYVWHVLNHAVPLLWRFHKVHHSDMDVDASTAVRFHPGELAVSAVVKMGLIYFLGASLVGVVIFEAVTVAAAQFHHGNFRLPALLERGIRLLVVAPSMHRVHHSSRAVQTNSNYGTLLSLWDRVFGTFRGEMPDASIVLGLAEHRSAVELTLPKLLAMPLEASAPAARPVAAEFTRSEELTAENAEIRREGLIHPTSLSAIRG